MVKNKPCPKCRAKGRDSTGDHLYRAMKGSKELSFYICRVCKYREYIDGTPLDYDEEEEEDGLKVSLATVDVAKFPSVSDRGISRQVREKYGVVSSLSGSGEVEKHYYPITKDAKLLTYKYRQCATKKFGRLKKGVGQDIDLFGMLSLSGPPRVVVITEGEEDAMAAYQMLDGTVSNLACLSMPDGSSNDKAVKDNLPWLNKADKIYLSIDKDEAGEKLKEKLVLLVPNAYIIDDIGAKDANECLLAGRSKAYVNAFLRAKKYTPKFLVRVADVKADAMKKPEWGRAYPWETLNKATYGMRDGEGIYVGAGVKIGKSEFLNQLIISRIDANDGDIPAVAKFEEKPSVTLRRLSGKRDGLAYHKPGIHYDERVYRATLDSFDDRLLMYKAFGQATWDDVKLWIRCCVAEGSKTVIIDPLTKLTNHLNSSDTEAELRRMSDEIACMSHDLGFFYVITCHLKAPPSGKTPHEKGGKVESNQFRGSRAMMENTYYLLGIERNKDPELPEDERNTSTFVLLEDRNFGNVSRFPVFYDKVDQSYSERSLTKHT